MKEFVLSTLRWFVEHPSDLRITQIDGQKTCAMEIRCHADDVGKVIGKNGKTISALRVLVGSLAQKQQRRAVLEVIE